MGCEFESQFETKTQKNQHDTYDNKWLSAMIYNASGKSYFILKRWGSLRKLHSQHLASSRPSEQSLTPSHTFLRGMQRPSPQRNWRGQAGDGQRATLDIICFRWVCKKTKSERWTYCSLGKRLCRAGESPCEWGIHQSGSEGTEERRKLAFCCCLILDYTV